jgi:DivIVA domain-containing protein
VDWHDIARLRSPDFTIVRRGYDKHEVDKFLEQLVDWLETDAAEDIGDVAVTRKLELVGKSTAHILLTTEQEAQELKRQTEEDCAGLRAKAEADDARRAREEATAEATETIEEGLRRRGQIDDQTHELEDHRAAVLEELGRLRAELSAAIDAHPPTPAKQNGEPDRNAPDAEPAQQS